jgi:hypothetical protein
MSWRLIMKRAQNIREVRFLVPTGDATTSAGLRSFINHQHKDLKMLNPALNMPVREGTEDLTPSVIVQYSSGDEKRSDVSGMDERGVQSAVQKLVEAAKFMKH